MLSDDAVKEAVFVRYKIRNLTIDSPMFLYYNGFGKSAWL